MLSIENPLQDPPCSSVLKSLSDEKKASDNLETVDLFKLDLLDNGHSLPKFSIRDYVYGSRGEDMSTNWPFSQKSLKLCMKHGLKELLPPFQPADAMRHPVSSGSKHEIDLLSNKKGDNLDDQDHLSVSYANTELDSATKSFTCSNKKSCPDVEDSGLQESLIGNKSEVFIRRGLKKRERIKCRMITKLSNIPCSNAKEDTDANAPLVSEAVCPVCRVFSSSSNTTLNAHIDQCLSGESTPKELGIFKLIKHRIKPKKVRLMVDIYKTAEHCTLEDLDKRNGTNWASNLALPALEEEMLADDHNDQELHFDENLSEGGPVYIDSSGTKLRILSKSSDLNVDSMYLDGPQAKKMKKKKNQIQKQHNIFNIEKKESSEINKPIDKKMLLEETNVQEQCMLKQLKDQNQVKFSKIETIKGWVCSKRSSLTKKKINCSVNDSNLRVKRNNSDESPVCNNRTKSLALEVLAEHGVNQLSKDSSTSCKDYVASPISKKRVVIKLGPYKSDDHQLSTQHDSFLSKSRKIPSLKKRLQRGTARSVSNSELCLMVKSSTLKKPREVAVSESQELTRTAKARCEESIESSVVRRFNGSKGRISRNKEEDMKIAKSTALSYRSDDDDDDTSMSDEEGIDRNIDLSSEDEFGKLPLVGSSKSMNHGFNGLCTQTEAHCRSKKLVYGAEPGILSSKHDIFCSSVTPESMIMVEEDLGEEGQGNYVDPIPIPGPPGSFLPSPGRMDSDDLQGNSSLTSARFQCSIESPAVTSTNSISTMTRSGSKQSEKSSTLVAYSDFGNDQQCCFSRKDNVSLNYQDSLLLKRRAMCTTTQFCSGEIQMNSDLNRSPMPVDNGSIPTGIISLGVSVDSQVKFRDNGGYEFADPPATPVLRLMGKNLMVMNENETNASSLFKPFSYANLQAASGHTNASSQNTDYHKVRFSESRETCIVNPHDLRWSNGVGSYGNMAMSQTYACMNPTMSSTQSINQDLNHPGGYSSPNVKFQPANQINATPLTYNMVKHAHQPPNNSGDISSNTFRDVIIMDSTRDSEDCSTVISSNDYNRKEGSIGIPVSSSSDDQNFTSYYLTQRYKDARYNGFLFDANSSTQSPTGINAHPF